MTEEGDCFFSSSCEPLQRHTLHNDEVGHSTEEEEEWVDDRTGGCWQRDGGLGQQNREDWKDEKQQGGEFSRRRMT